jgi:UDP-3-O-[3-hydroxymyristoyl] glucosamine N-acyltransferase
MDLGPQAMENAPAGREIYLSVVTHGIEAKMARTAGELAQYLQVTLEGDASAPISSVANPESAAPEDLIYVEQEKFRERAQSSRAHCIIAPPAIEFSGKTVFRTAAPKLAFAKSSAWLTPPVPVPAGIHPSAVISASAKIAERVVIGPFAVVEDGAVIAAHTQIGAYCFIGAGATIGQHCHLYPRVTLYAGVRLGARVILNPGVVIGGDGFGYVFGEGKQWKFPQVGGVEIGDDVEIGCGTTIDRGSLGITRIGAGVKIDNLVQIGHNVEIGEHTVIAAQTGISGSSRIGRKVMLAGQVGIAEHCTLEDGVIVGGQAGVLPGKTIRAGEVVWGTPARPLARFKEEYAWFSRLPAIGKRLRKSTT